MLDVLDESQKSLVMLLLIIILGMTLYAILIVIFQHDELVVFQQMLNNMK